MSVRNLPLTTSWVSSFTILMRHSKCNSSFLLFQLDSIHEVALTFITWIACVLSIFSLVLSLSCFTLLKAVHSIRNSIHKNLTFALLAAQLIFLVGIERTGNQVSLKVVYFGVFFYSYVCIYYTFKKQGVNTATSVNGDKTEF